jgi:hypothetical protein
MGAEQAADAALTRQPQAPAPHAKRRTSALLVAWLFGLGT